MTEKESWQDIKDSDMKKKKGNALLFLGVLLVLAGLGYLGYMFYSYKKAEDAFAEIADTYVEQQEEETQWWETLSIDFEGLKERNPDVIGWIYMPGNEYINYPILQGEDDDTYLRRDLDGNASSSGSIFMETLNASDFSDYHTILYGHNMRNKSMFGSLKLFKDESYYEEHSIFYIYTENAAYCYTIFSYHDVPEDSSIYTIGFQPGEIYEAFLEELLRASYYDCGVEVNEEDQVVTLSTCSATGYRFVVHGVLTEIHVYE